MRSVEVEKIKDYAAEDADITYQLKQKLDGGLNTGRLREVFNGVEMPLVAVLADIEREE